MSELKKVIELEVPAFEEAEKLMTTQSVQRSQSKFKRPMTREENIETVNKIADLSVKRGDQMEIVNQANETLKGEKARITALDTELDSLVRSKKENMIHDEGYLYKLIGEDGEGNRITGFYAIVSTGTGEYEALLVNTRPFDEELDAQLEIKHGD